MSLSEAKLKELYAKRDSMRQEAFLLEDESRSLRDKANRLDRFLAMQDGRFKRLPSAGYRARCKDIGKPSQFESLLKSMNKDQLLELVKEI